MYSLGWLNVCIILLISSFCAFEKKCQIKCSFFSRCLELVSVSIFIADQNTFTTSDIDFMKVDVTQHHSPPSSDPN